MKKQNGFTLIELLVVIAIIGILSAVVLAALTTARTKGNDAAIKADLETVRTQAVIYFDKNGSYNPIGATGLAINGTQCGLTSGQTAGTMLADPNISAALLAAYQAYGGSAANAFKCNIKSDGTAYAIAVTLASGKVWCTDSTSASQGTIGGAADNGSIYPSGNEYNLPISSAGGGALNTSTSYVCN